LVDIRADVEAEVGGDLLIAAAAAVEFVARVSDESDELFFDEVVDVFGFAVFEKPRIGGLSGNLVEALENRDEFFRRQNAHALESLSVCATGRQLVWQQALIVRKRPLPALEFGIERLAETA
jgi:hypothetical protein